MTDSEQSDSLKQRLAKARADADIADRVVHLEALIRRASPFVNAIAALAEDKAPALTWLADAAALTGDSGLCADDEHAHQPHESVDQESHSGSLRPRPSNSQFVGHAQCVTDTAVSHSPRPRHLDVQTCVRFSSTQYEALVALARDQDRSVGSVIRRALQQALPDTHERRDDAAPTTP